jgi:predicted helicase
VRILNLHGSARRGDAAHGDENVFDIQQGVCVSIISTRADGLNTDILYGDLLGSQESKFDILKASKLSTLVAQPLATGSNSRPFVPFRDDSAGELEEWPINRLFGSGNPKADRNKRYGAGFKSRQDTLVVALSLEELEARIADLANPMLSDADLRDLYNLCSTAHFEIRKARAYAEQGLLKRSIINLRYRPFDDRLMIWSRAVMCEPQESVTQHLLPNHLCLSITRVVKDPEFRHVLAVKGPVEVISLSGSTSTNAYMFPLWWHDTSRQTFIPNIAPAFAARIAALTGLAWDDCIEKPKQSLLDGIMPKKPEQTTMFAKRRERGELGRSFGPRDLFDYIYAMLHSPAYRKRYADHLKSDFARIPLPRSRAVFEALVPLGTELVALHLLDPETLPILIDPKSVRLAGSGEARVTMPAAKFECDAFDNGRMYITTDKNRWFETVPVTTADFHVGGYQPARKWLKDRAARGGKKASPGRLLTDEDVLHYRRMIVALTRTAELMPKIDEEIEKHGGWPGAFRGMSG